MKKRMRKIAAMLLCGFMMLSMGITVMGVEWLPGRSWYHTTVVNDHDVCQLTVNATYVTGDWRYELTRAYDNWNNYSNGYVNIQQAAFANAKITLHVQNGLPVDLGGHGVAAAMTYISDLNGNVFSNNNQISNFGSYIDVAMIVFNTQHENGILAAGLTTDPSMNRAKTITHELGHCINLGHRTGYNHSVMRGG